MAPDISSTETEYGTVLLDKKSGKYWNLNPTGTLIWQSILGSGDLNDAVNALVDTYDVDRTTASRDAQSVIDGLVDAGIIVEEI
ncbi:lasso peptide biosynthesis PqqD family chaperone [Gordonia sp. ABSL11-1]|uniref:lasso peptide biosynthesis PqqD family chaperone n=1 Tax=Gordonia sp. ABSL11-1 TaxID=3053924 RepID=UPI0025748892|nr:lasso peptide biosynthesis PqqD family chaperone [Gordonia sp. ABSL11-1]MDL9949028.1 lasso peptide biosynthesis PqqD family chaperone [Gordonia sp. ABSL11-1]